MKGFSITSLMIMIVIGLSVMIGIGSFYNDVATTYGIEGSSTSYSTFLQFNNTLSSLSTPLTQMQKNIVGAVSSGFNIPQALYDATAALFNLGQVFFNIPGVIGGFISTMFAVLSNNAIIIPNWVGTMIALVVLIIVTMQVIRMFTKSFFEV